MSVANKRGRAGEIRTHDLLHPMIGCLAMESLTFLGHYSAALSLVC